MATDLFGNPANPEIGAKIDNKKRPKGVKGEMCRDCTHCFAHQYRNDWVYCAKRPDPRTAYGRKKIKKTDAKCHMFEARAEK